MIFPGSSTLSSRHPQPLVSNRNLVRTLKFPASDDVVQQGYNKAHDPPLRLKTKIQSIEHYIAQASWSRFGMLSSKVTKCTDIRLEKRDTIRSSLSAENPCRTRSALRARSEPSFRTKKLYFSRQPLSIVLLGFSLSRGCSLLTSFTLRGHLWLLLGIWRYATFLCYLVSRIPETVCMAAITIAFTWKNIHPCDGCHTEESFGDGCHINGLRDIASLAKEAYRTEVIVSL